MRLPLARRLVVVVVCVVIICATILAGPLVTYRASAWAAAFYNMGALPGTSFPSSSGDGVSPEGGVAVGRCSTNVPGDQPATIRAGDKIANIIPYPVLTGEVKVVAELNESSRKAGGFGSSGR